MNSATTTLTSSRLRTVGWLIVLMGSLLLIVYGAVWYFEGPETALENVAERVALAPDEFRRERPGVTGTALDVITIVARTQALYGAGLGLLAVLVAWQGYRGGSRWAWAASWVPVAAVGGAGISFALAGGAPVGVVYLGLAGLVAAGLLLAIPRAEDQTWEPGESS